MAKYFAHKPQYRRGTTPRPAPVLEYTRDFRSGEFNFTGPVYQPDPRQSRSGRVPSIPRRSWGSPVNPSMNMRAAREAQRMREFRRSIGRGMAGAFRMVGPMWDMYDAYRSIDDMLGGQPWGWTTDEQVGGGPTDGSTPFDRNWAGVRRPEFPDTIIVPTPDLQSGWNTSVDDSWVQAYHLHQYRHNNGFWYWGRPWPEGPWGGLHRPPANSSGTYSPAQVIELGEPPSLSSGLWRVQNRVQLGDISSQPETYFQQLGPYKFDWSKSAAPGELVWPGPFTVPGNSAPATFEQVNAAWPRERVLHGSLLPWPSFASGAKWENIPARNKLWARVLPNERTESYGPPVDPNKPSQVIHRPPGRNETETKRRANSEALLWWYRAAKKTWHEAGEYCDRIGAIFDALPKDVRTSYRRSGPGRNVFTMRPWISCADKTALILQNLHRLDVNQAILNLVENEIEDKIIGAGFKSLDEAAKRLGIPGWRVDLAMSGNVEEAIAFLFEIKKALTP